jgi:glycosyltransferase involved in cell wall biosynthesis
MVFSKSDKVKVAIVMPIWAPMRHLLFEELASKSRVQLKVFYEKKEVPHRPSWKPSNAASYDYEIVYSYHPRWLKRYRLLPYRLPFLLGRYQPDVVVVVNLAQAIFALGYARLKHKNLILWTGESEHILKCRSMPAVWLIRKVLYPLVDGFGCYSKRTMSFLQHKFAVPSLNIFQIPQCVDHRHFIGNHEARAPGDLLSSEHSKIYIFLSVGQLIYLKGYDLLIKAWGTLPKEILEKTILRIAGTGPLNSNLNNLINRAGLTNVELIGFVHYEDLPFLYGSADIFILPTREDTWGLVVNEAMASGLPVLCSKYAHAQEMIVEGENGHVFDPLNAEDTISKIKTMYERRSEWGAMGRYGREMMEKKYSVESAAKDLLEGIERAIQKHRK